MVPRTAYIGGFGSGKSYIACLKAVVLAAINQNCPGVVCSPTYPMLKDILLPTMFDEILTPLKLITHIKWVASELRIEFPWKSNIIFRSADKPMRLRGLNLAWGQVDEASLVEKFDDLWQSLVSRLRHPRTATTIGPDGKPMPLYFLGLTCTPEGQNDGVYDKFVRPPEDPAAYRRWREKFVVIRSSTMDNPAVTDEFVEMLTADTPEELRPAYLEGHYVDIKRGKAYWSMTDERIVAHDYDPSKPLRITFDFNVAPMVCLICQTEENPPQRGTKINVLEEIALVGSNTREVCTLITERYPSTSKTVYIYGDATGSGGTAEWSDYDTIREVLRPHFPNMRINVGTINKSHKIRMYSVNKKLSSKELDVHPNARRLIRDLRYQRVEDNGISKSKKQIMDGESLGHAADCLDYIIIWHWEYKIPKLREIRKKKDGGGFLGHTGSGL